METTLTLIKYTASVLAAFYGVYATVTDFKLEGANNVKRLSTQGRIGIALLAMLFVLSFAADILHDRLDAVREQQQTVRDADQRRLESAKQQQLLTHLRAEIAATNLIAASLERTSSTVAKTAADTKRVLIYTDQQRLPLGELYVEYTLELPLSMVAVRSYLAQLQDAFTHGNLTDRTRCEVVVVNGKPQKFTILDPSLLSAGTDVAMESLFRMSALSLEFHGNPIDPSRHWRKVGPRAIMPGRPDPVIAPDMVRAVVAEAEANWQASRRPDVGSQTIDFDIAGQRLLIHAHSKARVSPVWPSLGRSLTIPELLSAQLFVSVASMSYDPEHVRLHEAIRLQSLQFRFQPGPMVIIMPKRIRRLSLDPAQQPTWVVQMSSSRIVH